MTTFKKILVLVLALCMMTSMFALTSCKKDNDTDNQDNNNPGNNAGNNPPASENVYTITVVDKSGNPVAGVAVTVSPTFSSYTSDANGKITFESDSNQIQAMVTSSPDGYQHDTNIVSFPSGSKELTLTVTKIADSKVNYTIKVVDDEGNPVPDVLLQICYGTICLDSTFVTDSNGEITVSITSGYKVYVKIRGIPSGYTEGELNEDNYHLTIPENVTNGTLVLTKN